MLRIALAQMEVVCGQPQHNFQQMKDQIEKAKAQHADLIVFSELCVGGYFLGDRYLDDDFCRYLASFNDKIKELADGIGVIWGNIGYQSLDGKTIGRDGRPARSNNAYFADQQAWVEHEKTTAYAGVYTKHLNPDYRFFEDSRYFFSALELDHQPGFLLEESHRPFLFKGYRIGLEVCEDMWSSSYSLDMTAYYAECASDYVINLSASPWTKAKEQARHRCVKNHLAKYQIPTFVYVNQVGIANNGKNVTMFDGGSFIYQHNALAASCNDHFEKQLLIWDGMQEQLTPSQPYKLMDALIYGIKQFDAQIFHGKVPWIIGLSGGLDSTISCALLCMALGKERIRAFNMSTSYNSSLTQENAALTAKSLGVSLVGGRINEVVEATKDAAIHEFGYAAEQLDGLVHENIQARIRGHMLSTFASIHGGVICNNGNKVEVALGYFTLYGDSIGALSLLGDVLKTEVAQLGYEINERLQKEIVPLRLLPQLQEDGVNWDMAPSAELKENQVDPMKWYYHDALIDRIVSFPTYRVESFMKQYLDGSLLQDETFGKWLKFYGLTNPQAFIDDLEWVLRLFQRAIFKRIQLPPLLTVSKGAFGNDLKEAQIQVEFTDEYQKLKQQILQMDHS